MSESIKELAPALVAFQEQVKNPKNSENNDYFNSKYAPLDVVINTSKPILAKHGLAVIQSTGSEGENVVIKTMLMHKSGEWIESDALILPAYQKVKGGGREFNAQGAGSAVTYGRRYQYAAMLGIASEDDDDGNGQAGHYTGNGGQAPNNGNQGQAPRQGGQAAGGNNNTPFPATQNQVGKCTALFKSLVALGCTDKYLMQKLRETPEIGDFKKFADMTSKQASNAITHLTVWEKTIKDGGSI